MFRLFLAGSVSASLLSVHAAVFDPLDSQDGKTTAKLRPKEDSDCRSFWSSASAQIRSRQEDVEGQEELEPAFKVQFREAIHTISCRVDGRSRSSRERSSMMWTI